MKSRLVLSLIAILSASPALAGLNDPPAGDRLFYYAGNDEGYAFVDFATLYRSEDGIEGWTYLVYTQVQTPAGLGGPVGSYWQPFLADCAERTVTVAGIAWLAEGGALISGIEPDAMSVTRDAGEGSFDEALLDLICVGAEPTDVQPYLGRASAEEAARAAYERSKNQ